jgi:hypothetical protein
MNPDPDSLRWRQSVYMIFIVVVAGIVAGRILSVARVYEPHLFRGQDADDLRSIWPSSRPEPMPTHGDNDRSRWDTIRALVDQGTYVIGERDPSRATSQNRYGDVGIISEDGWKTIDKVLQPETQKFYSSKPPFLATLLAGEYWLLKTVFGLSIVDQRWEVVRVILFTINWLPLVVYFFLLSRLVEEIGTTDWGRIFVFAAGCFGTFLIPFATTLNNHTVAACSALFALYPALRIWSKISSGGSRIEDRGSNESQLVVPALAGKEDRLKAELQATADPPSSNRPLSPWLYIGSGFFAGFTACCELPAASFASGLLVAMLWQSPKRALAYFLPAAALPVIFFLVTNYLAFGSFIPIYSELGGPWYQYEGSHWKEEPGQVKQGIDFQHENKIVYAFHWLLGHHGLFSLTPIFLFSIVGIGFCLSPNHSGSPGPRIGLRILGTLSLVVTLVVVGFYIVRTNNYGGWTSGPRWLMWLTPFLLLTMIPAADWLAPKRWGRALAYAFLAISVLSVSYPAWNPWRHPWLYNLMENWEWIGY